MRWEGQEQSDNVEDRRGGGGGFGFGGRSLGLGSIAIALVAGWIFGVNPLTILGLMSGNSGTPVVPQTPAPLPPVNDKMASFVSTILKSTEQVWAEQFRQARSRYQPPRLVLFTDREPTACGTGQAAMGPFYCPADRKVYIDLHFYDVMRNKLGAPGDFAQAYVIAHEVGHHVQNLLGTAGKVAAARGRLSEAQANALSVKLELQADCFAGVWAYHSQETKGWLDAGDIEEALNAASQIGDDTLQRRSRGAVVPETFTHGSSAQRVAWFKRGQQTGSVDQCNTFDVRSL